MPPIYLCIYIYYLSYTLNILHPPSGHIFYLVSFFLSIFLIQFYKNILIKRFSLFRAPAPAGEGEKFILVEGTMLTINKHKIYCIFQFMFFEYFIRNDYHRIATGLHRWFSNNLWYPNMSFRDSKDGYFVNDIIHLITKQIDRVRCWRH